MSENSHEVMFGRTSLFREGLDPSNTTHETAKDVGACNHAFFLRPNQDYIIIDDIVTGALRFDLKEADHLAKATLGVVYDDWAMAMNERTKLRGREQRITEKRI